MKFEQRGAEALPSFAFTRQFGYVFADLVRESFDGDASVEFDVLVDADSLLAVCHDRAPDCLLRTSFDTTQAPRGSPG